MKKIKLVTAILLTGIFWLSGCADQEIVPKADQHKNRTAMESIAASNDNLPTYARSIRHGQRGTIR